MTALDVARTAKALRVLSQLAHEVHTALEDAATDLELLAPDDEAVEVTTDPEAFTPAVGPWKPCARCGTGYLAGSPALCATHGLCAECHHADGVTDGPEPGRRPPPERRTDGPRTADVTQLPACAGTARPRAPLQRLRRL